MPGRKSPVSWLITAEHASHRVPRRWQPLFAEQPGVLETHRAWDPGSLALARALAQRVGAKLMTGGWSRLLIDLNRSEDHPRRFSEFSRTLPESEQEELTEAIWRPHWRAYSEFILAAPGTVFHLACHSFVPELNGKVRSTEIGLLHDPKRPAEDAFCRQLQRTLKSRAPELAVHRNRPYRGTSDGIGAWHRGVFDDSRLITLEIELNQRFASGPDAVRARQIIIAAVEAAAESFAE